MFRRRRRPCSHGPCGQSEGAEDEDGIAYAVRPLVHRLCDVELELFGLPAASGSGSGRGRRLPYRVYGVSFATPARPVVSASKASRLPSRKPNRKGASETTHRMQPQRSARYLEQTMPAFMAPIFDRAFTERRSTPLDFRRRLTRVRMSSCSTFP